jgi:hypothetical protein
MITRKIGIRMTTAALIAAMWILPLAAIGQTQITAPKNKYKVQEDVSLGNKTAIEIERQFPVLNDRDATNYVSRVGENLVASIPPQFRQPQFDYRFKIVNARDLNAFALPGGPMYVNRGMIEAARNEGELAGVMAHEISHVALRHATAQATEQSKPSNTLGMLGMIIGGAVLGGDLGAQIGMLGATAMMTKYSRAYETQADTLGAQIMADAGYDPRDLANVFQTISRQGGGGGPEFLSSHPDPGNRYSKINQMAATLRVSPNPIKITRDFERVQARLRGLPRARSMAELEREYSNGRRGTNSRTTAGRYYDNVAYPSARLRTYTGMSGLEISVPSNWRDVAGGDSVQFAPDGAYGDQGITRGAMIGVYRGQGSLARDTQNYVNEVLQGNSYLRQQGGSSRAYVGGRSGLVTNLSGRSPITGRSEQVAVYTVPLRNGNLFYIITVVPQDEAYSYLNAFRNMLSSVGITD